ncbi:hypothetical protein [Pseudoxanthomonas sp. JBR18]|uniref:hypothetical protein n=1 Tax=Pseudoxanthomonas sp. JBR18 TaxID=2969308 RepID=UPI0023052CCC|nr:hypothetical protein [Pseudoxanthomonas sp. JBR18]WCE06160.1 hypothetical protein PJ250_09530 [Pseudoxanthomonas sp. JBR18]
MWARWTAAIVLGLPATTGVIGLLALLWPGPVERTTLPWLLLAVPVWVGAMSLAFACRSGARAWGWLGGITVLAFVALHLVKALGWTGLPA